MPIHATAVLFDLDGTLLDTAPDMIGAINALRAEHGREPLSLAAARAYVSHGAAALVNLGFDSPPEPEFSRLRQRFLDVYFDRLAQETVLFAGCDLVLEHLERERIPWGIVTNKPGWLTAPLLDALDLSARAACVVSGDTLTERKPHPLPLLHAARSIGCEPGDCVYVGDALRDVQAARAAGMRPVVASFGYIAASDEAHLWPADAWIDRPADLLEWMAAA